MRINARATTIFIFLLGAYVRVINIWQPLDGSMKAPWRESDVASIARNYYREGMNIFSPRIDWRGDGPGYAEMEFPVLPWMIALFYKVFGYHEIAGKLLSFSFSLASLLIFLKLSHYFLPKLADAAATLFFALNPLLFRTANTLQPESLMFMLYLLAVYAFLRWIQDDSKKYYIIALIATALSILVKASAAHIGLFYLLFVIRQRGFKFLQNWSMWLFAVLSLLPALLWYTHAHQLWLQYGNSLGVSNESHWVGLDFFKNIYFIKGIINSEIRFVWMPTGLFIIVTGLMSNRRNLANQICVMWLIAIFLYYFIAARTTADEWAYYYHIFAVPPIAILFGNSVCAIAGALRKDLHYLMIGSAIMAIALISSYLFGFFVFSKMIKLVLLLVLSGVLILPLLRLHIFSSGAVFLQGRFLVVKRLMIYVLILFIPATYLYMALRITSDAETSQNERLQSLFEFAQEIKSLIPDDALIISSGGICRDPDGHPVAYNASYMFLWLDRKGFNICEEEQSITAVQHLAERGAKFFIAEKEALNTKPPFKNQLNDKFILLKECSEAYLFDLRVPN